jgi:uncharacterized damage-inducible protein DinB
LTLPIELSQTVFEFAELTQNVNDSALNAAWAWGSYTSEGIRFAHFRVYEALESLAVRSAGQRIEAGTPASEAAQIMGQYQLAYRDLQAVLLGVSDELAAQAPAEKEWSVQQTYAHILQADIGFFATVQHGLEQIRAGISEPKGPGEADYDRLLPDMPEAAYQALSDTLLSEQSSLHDLWQPRILAGFVETTVEELDRHIAFWEEETYPVRFRLGRYAAHMRQHTIQIEKSLAALGHPLNEARRLHRLNFSALARAEAAALGGGKSLEVLQSECSAQIREYHAGVKAALEVS